MHSLQNHQSYWPSIPAVGMTHTQTQACSTEIQNFSKSLSNRNIPQKACPKDIQNYSINLTNVNIEFTQ